MLRDMALAYAFGTQSAVAALLVAFRFAHLLRRLLGEGAMQSAFIPHFEEMRKESPLRAGRFFCHLTVSLSHFLFFLILIIMGALGAIYVSGYLSEGNAEIVLLTLLLMPSLLFICLFGINASLLQCEKSYFISSAAPVLFNLFWVIGILFTFTLPVFTAMRALSLFIIAACFAQWAFTVPKTYRLLRSYGIVKPWKEIQWYPQDVKRLAKPLFLGIVGVAAAQINNALDAVFARWADVEGPAFLWYAIRLQQLPLALFGIAISGALLPPLARAVKADQFLQFRHFLQFSLQRTMALMVPLMAILFVAGQGCVAFVFGHGDFTSESISSTTQALWGYVFGLVPMALVLVLATAFYARGDYRTPSIASLASMGLNIGLNTFLVAGMGLGAASVALATSVSAWFNLFWLAGMLVRTPQLNNFWRSHELWESVGKVCLATAAAALSVVGSDVLFWHFDAFLDPNISSLSFAEQLFHLGIEGTVFLFILISISYFIKAKEITQLFIIKNLV